MKATIEAKAVMFFANPAGSYNDKFNRMAKLAKQYSVLMGKLTRFTNQAALSDRYMCALACQLMAKTGLRVGNEESADGYVSKREGVGELQTYGLTTLLKDHVTIRSGVIKLRFTGKRGIDHVVTLTDPVISAKLKLIIRETDSDKLFPISDYKLRLFVKTYVGKKFVPKDFRTLIANVEAYHYYNKYLKGVRCDTQREVKAEVRGLVEHVSEILGNTPAMARRAYIDPRLIEFVASKL